MSADSNNTPVYGIWSKDGAGWTLLYQYPCTIFFAEATRILKKARNNNPRAILKIDIIPDNEKQE